MVKTSWKGKWMRPNHSTLLTDVKKKLLPQSENIINCCLCIKTDQNKLFHLKELTSLHLFRFLAVSVFLFYILITQKKESEQQSGAFNSIYQHPHWSVLHNSATDFAPKLLVNILNLFARFLFNSSKWTEKTSYWTDTQVSFFFICPHQAFKLTKSL